MNNKELIEQMGNKSLHKKQREKAYLLFIKNIKNKTNKMLIKCLISSSFCFQRSFSDIWRLWPVGPRNTRKP